MKKFFNLHTIYAGLSLLTVFTLGSCNNDEESYDFPGDAKNRAYLNNTTVYSFSVLHTPVGSIGDVKAKFPVFCTRKSATDMKVSFAVDTALVSAYNKEHLEDYKPIPPDMVVFSGSLSIAKESRGSADSVTVSVSENLSRLTDSKYLVPVVISALDNSENAAISTNLNVVYLKIKTSVTNCFPTPLITDMTGTLITPKTGWTAALNISAYYNPLSRLFDDKTTTYAYVYPSQACELTVDMASEYSQISGIRISSYSTSYGIKTANVFSSNDGVSWTSQGAATLSTATAYQYIKFYSPVSARYFKIGITGWTSSYYIRFAEFDVYQTN